ncbi:MAG: hypothetical protein QNI84_01345 [Henriciella sp.]|nr:hypothetical protein [Henriciella sp.]
MRLSVLGLLLLLLASACAIEGADQHPEANSELILDGYFKLAVPADANIPDDCFLGMPDDYGASAQDPFACVAHPFNQDDGARDPAFDYIRQLEQQGWSDFGGAANVFWVYRENNGDCRDKLYLAALISGDVDEVAKWGGPDERDMDWSKIDKAVYLFSPTVEGSCDQ